MKRNILFIVTIIAIVFAFTMCDRFNTISEDEWDEMVEEALGKTPTPTITLPTPTPPGQTPEPTEEVTATPTDVPVTATPTDVPVTATPTDVPVTATPTDVPVTATPTDVPATATPTDVPVTATPTSVAEPTPGTPELRVDAGGTTSSTIQLRWYAISNTSSVEIHRSLDGAAYSLYDTVNSGATLYYNDTGVSEGNTYWYKIYGVNSESVKGLESNTVSHNIPSSITWSQLGSSVSTNADYPMIGAYDDATNRTVVIAGYKDGDYSEKLTLRKHYYNGSWTTVGSPGTSSVSTVYDLDMYAVDSSDQLYIAYVEDEMAIPRIICRRYDNAEISSTSTALGSGGEGIVDDTGIYTDSPVSFYLQGSTPHIAYVADVNLLYVAQYVAGTWGFVKNGGSDSVTSNQILKTERIKLSYFNSTYYVMCKDFNDLELRLFTRSGTGWLEQTGNAVFNPGINANYPDMAPASDGMYITFKTNEIGTDQYKVVVYKNTVASASNWQLVGGAAASPSTADWPSIQVYNDTLYIAFVDYSQAQGQITVRKYDGVWRDIGSTRFTAETEMITDLSLQVLSDSLIFVSYKISPTGITAGSAKVYVYGTPITP